MGRQPCPTPAVKAWVHFSGGGELTSYRGRRIESRPRGVWEGSWGAGLPVPSDWER